jgi:hypothetical protein
MPQVIPLAARLSFRTRACLEEDDGFAIRSSRACACMAQVATLAPFLFLLFCFSSPPGNPLGPTELESGSAI